MKSVSGQVSNEQESEDDGELRCLALALDLHSVPQSLPVATRTMPRPETIPDDDPVTLQEASKITGFSARSLALFGDAGTLPVRYRQNGEVTTTRAALRKTIVPFKRNPDVKERVYVIGYGPYVKIGFTGQALKIRICSIQTPEPLVVYADLVGQNRQTEKMLHKRFASLRLRGEWFRHEGKLRAWIKRGCPI